MLELLFDHQPELLILEMGRNGWDQKTNRLTGHSVVNVVTHLRVVVEVGIEERCVEGDLMEQLSHLLEDRVRHHFLSVGRSHVVSRSDT
ncbi:hypothetical protein D3C73_1200080 [compost metagenome]